MARVRLIQRITRRFGADERGAVLAETLIVVPFVTLFSVGILEFGNMFWQKQQIEVGLRDAARYLARCHTTSPTSFTPNCSQAIARNIAVFGNPAGTGAPRVPDWTTAAGDVDITITGEVIRVSANHTYFSSPLFGWLDLDAIAIQSFHEERYIGW